MQDETIEYVDPEYMEKCIIKSAFNDKQYSVLISEKFLTDYFDSDAAGTIFWKIKEHINKYNDLPNHEIIVNSIESEESQNKAKEFLDEINSIDFNVDKNYNWLFENTNNYLKDKALKHSIMKSIDVIEKRQDNQLIRNLVEEALCKDLKVDLGLDYFGELNTRLKRIFEATDLRVPTYFPYIDEIISNGLPAYTLSVWAAVTHGGKSLLMANMLARQVLNGHKGVLFTMEMSEDAFAQRFDSIYSYQDINKMYIQEKMKRKLINKLKEVKSTENRGDIWIKEFPTGKATVNDLRTYLRELALRGIKPDVIYADYITIMAPTKSKKNKRTDEDVAEIVRDLRALSLEFKAPVVSVAQINREGGFLNLKELDFNYIGTAIAIAQDADFVGILGHDPDKLNYESELHYKIVKNRLGGRVGTIGKLYMDTRNLRLYDECEFDQWIEDAKVSGDDRNPH